MADMKVRDFDEMRVPSRRPWIIVVVIVIVGVGLFRYFAGRDTEKSREPLPVEEIISGEPAEREPVAPSDVNEVLAEAREMETEGELGLARKKYMSLLDEGLPARVRRDAEGRVGTINIQLVMTPRAMPEKQDYVVQNGDQLGAIAAKFGTTIQLLQKSNEILNRDKIRVGDLYRVFSGKFEITVSKSRNDLLVTVDGRFFKRYRIATGKYGKTPKGTFTVHNKDYEPDWYRADKVVPFGDKENILGTRWLGLKASGDTIRAGGYGIHGTWDDSSIGKAASAGCVRMRNPDVEELFIMIPLGTSVTVTD